MNLLATHAVSLGFEMIAWTQRKNEIVSRLDFAIHDRLAPHSIEIA